jgi:hypothetical protein
MTDHDGYDRWRDDLAVPDPYDQDYEPAREHGLITDVAAAVTFPAAATTGDRPDHPSGRPVVHSADARPAHSAPLMRGGTGSRT